MIDLAALPPDILVPACFLGGILLGYGYFCALRETTKLIVSQAPPLLALVLTFGRLVVLSAGLYLAVLGGGFALIAALAGVLCAKALMLRQTRRVAP